MNNNIKTEIIYYGMSTDFEFEFNLCGCCHMRLLTSVTDDKTELLKALQRSITRSRVILIIGNITEENNIISFVADSIGYKTEKVDTESYEIANPENAIMVKGSVPLITDDGIYGGCIIESGPQSMIFLTEEKDVRRAIMKELVHSYIKDLSEYPIEAINTSPSNEITTKIEETNDNLEENAISEATEVLEVEEEALEADEEKTEEPIIEESTIEEPIIEEPENDPFKIETLLNKPPITIEDYETDKTDESEEAEEDNDFYKAKQPASVGAIDIFTLILSVILLVILAFVVYSYIYLPLSEGISVFDNIKNIFSFLMG